ncbi:phosphoribosylamine--glycine ligase [Helicobacter didelphidarum]|uniref:Phosphoribosylamine--glycine ligase n=1 Tax=Helicobacter didelphidarum TaxID=2040648 RepID=A0A3D8IMB5_9HELI|nr:phosphoribosylamine--glycine ligase [Helicobacter didelphidarum]RDU66379.1 phosphoribosylamine--glycine ligase [Helicobacter didelphidarum]
MQHTRTLPQSVLIIGNGGREYAIALALQQDKEVGDIFFAPQNPAATLYLNAKSLTYKNHDELLQVIQENYIALVVIGPEAPLMDGISDFLRLHGIPVFGPSLANAQLEGSKAYMKEFISNIHVPTARYREIMLENIIEGFAFIESLPLPIVLKANGLCGGKGVLILDSKTEAKEKLQEMLEGKLFGDSGKKVIIEEFLDGYELSVFALSNGDDYVVLPACQDHKRLFDGDKGPNTGGMGAYTKLPKNLYNDDLEEKIKNKILTPTFQTLKNMGQPYQGVLFAGIMIVKNEPYLLEYNVRFGDPECEVLLPTLKTPLFKILSSFAKGEKIDTIEFYDIYCVCVVLSSSDYAQNFKSENYPAKITFQDSCKDVDSTLQNKDSEIGHFIFANTTLKDRILYANSGRAVVVLGKGKNIQEARDNAYKLATCIDFEGKHYRKDIGYQALKNI